MDQDLSDYQHALKSYPEKLKESAQNTNSIVCMGLDPVLEAMPFGFHTHIEEFPSFLQNIFAEMERRNIFPGAYKPNRGYYSIHGYEGMKALDEILMNIYGESHWKLDIPIIYDYKCGDIGPSSENYAKEAFHLHAAIRAVTVSPYMGTDSVEPFLKYSLPLTEEDIQEGEEHTSTLIRNRGIYILNRTSNPGAKDFQNLELKDGRFVYEVVAEKIIEWSKKYPGTGAVVGATSLEELSKLAKMYAPHRIPLLIPGVGKQGGSAKEVANVLREARYPLYLARINSSSGLTHPWYKKGITHPWNGDMIVHPKNFAEISVDELQKLNEEIGPIF